MSSTCALVPRSLTSTNPLPGWLADTFVNSDGAEAALCADRSGFLRNDQLELIPLDIQRHIIHPDVIAHIAGFRELFNYLNTNPTANSLRQHVVDYFNDQPSLRVHLREPLSGFPRDRIEVILRLYNYVGHPGAAAPPFKKELLGTRYRGEFPEMACATSTHKCNIAICLNRRRPAVCTRNYAVFADPCMCIYSIFWMFFHSCPIDSSAG